MSALADFMAGDLGGPLPAGLEGLVSGLRQRFGGNLLAVVMYGSCLRNRDPGDGLVDLMAVVSSHRAAHGFGLAALANSLLPPNVYYLESGPEGRRLRSKFIVISLHALQGRCGGGLDGYFWARFTQPCRLAWVRDPGTARSIAECRALAAIHFARQAQSLGNGTLSGQDYWSRALGATYGCELRPEPPDASRRLVDSDPEFWDSLSSLVLPRLGHVDDAGPGRFQIRLPRSRRIAGKLRWGVRRMWGKSLNLARLVKAAGTFSNGLDYLAWKVERHSGVRVQPTERMRRHPRIAAWGLAWKLWRRGAFR